LHAYLFATPTGASVARSVVPDLPEPDPMDVPPATLDEAIALTRDALAALVDAEGSAAVEAENSP
jgi:hypothetical protein